MWMSGVCYFDFHTKYLVKKKEKKRKKSKQNKQAWRYVKRNKESMNKEKSEHGGLRGRLFTELSSTKACI